MRTIYVTGIIALLSVAMVLAVIPVSAQPTADSFGVEDASGDSGTYVAVPVNVTDVTNGPVQGIRSRIDYNESVLDLTGISNGDLTSMWKQLQLGEDRHTMTIATANTSNAIPNGSSGSVVLLNFSVISSPGDTSPMNMTLIELSNPDGVLGTAPAKNGTFTVSGTGVETATGSGTAYFDSDTGTLEGLTAIATLPEEGKPNLEFTHGFFSFNITGLTPGQTVNVTITLPGSAAGMEYWKYGPTPDNHTEHWYQFMYDGQTGAKINGNVVTLHFIDGLRGDDDLTQNGVIVDPSGPGGPPRGPPVAVPEYNIFGLLSLIGLLSVVLAVTTMGKGKRRE